MSRGLLLTFLQTREHSGGRGRVVPDCSAELLRPPAFSPLPDRSHPLLLVDIQPELADQHLEHVLESRPEPVPANGKGQRRQPRDPTAAKPSAPTPAAPSGARRQHRKLKLVPMAVNVQVRGRDVAVATCVVVVPEERFFNTWHTDLEPRPADGEVLGGGVPGAAKTHLEKEDRLAVDGKRDAFGWSLTDRDVGVAGCRDAHREWRYR